MIYEFPAASAPIRQGDIFVGLPRIDLSLERMPVIWNQDAEAEETPWIDVITSKKDAVFAVVAMRPVAAIVITQDCDAIRSELITLCEIRDFRDVERMAKDTKAATSWVNIITQQSKRNQKWFYLPPDATVGFSERMGVDFQVTLSLSRKDLEQLISLRKGRLNPVADEHFRERVAEYFRRYPYNEWYPLDAAELAVYQSKYPDAKPYPWQGGAASGDAASP